MNSKPSVITVAYADDHVAVRKGIISYLEQDEHIVVIKQASNGLEMLEQIMHATILPDICLIDINMPQMDGFKLLKEIKKRWPQMGCLVFTVFEFESHIIEMIKHGANGYLLKSCDPVEIVNAIYAIYHTQYYYSETANDATFDIAKNKNFKGIHFSEREVELLKYVCSEMSYADIAASMNTTYKTIDGIRERLCVKLGVSTRTGLALAAIQLGYYNIEPINNSQTTLH